MKGRSFSTRVLYQWTGTVYFILVGIFLTVLFCRSEDLAVRGAAVGFAVSAFLLGWLLLRLIRKKLIAFSESLCENIESIISGREITPDAGTETLAAKINFKLRRLYQIHLRGGERLRSEKREIQQIVSDVSHQVKTPIANLKMYNSTLRERRLSPDKMLEFLSLMDVQIDKLDFLMQSMVKASRLETGIVELDAKPSPIYNTIAQALGGIVLSAEKKNIRVSVSCDPSILIPHDPKWTAEALFNILDNAVKYTDSGGSVCVSAEKWKVYTKIDISDTGRGIPEKHYAQIFQRFYREEEVHDTPGVGLGLYLCREIIMREGGYLKVKSQVRIGSTFSVFLPNEKQP